MLEELVHRESEAAALPLALAPLRFRHHRVVPGHRHHAGRAGQRAQDRLEVEVAALHLERKALEERVSKLASERDAFATHRDALANEVASIKSTSVVVERLGR